MWKTPELGDHTWRQTTTNRDTQARKLCAWYLWIALAALVLQGSETHFHGRLLLNIVSTSRVKTCFEQELEHELVFHNREALHFFIRSFAGQDICLISVAVSKFAVCYSSFSAIFWQKGISQHHTHFLLLF